MVSAAMAVQDQSDGTRSNAVLAMGNRIMLEEGSSSIKGVQEEHVTSGEDFALKVRKPYTITKQRERWTEDEHKKFLEALKLYGRAWRRIEEHVGTKTAVQIRSHAQKFFSKVARESDGGDVSLVKPIEIPPPRPKRKPMHPYPRKLFTPPKTSSPIAEKLTRSLSLNSSLSERENQSPTSVLSADGSDILGTTDSNSPNGSPSPVSSVKPSGFLSSAAHCSSLEENGSASPARGNASSTADEQAPMKLELFCEDNAFVKECSSEAASIQTLKLFGTTMLVTSPTAETCKSLHADSSDLSPVQMLPRKLTPVKLSPGKTETAWSGGASTSLYYMQLPNEISNPAETGTVASMPWWSFPFVFPQFRNSVRVKTDPCSDKDIQIEGSWTGSNTGSVNVGGEGDRNWEVETQSHRLSCDKEENELGVSFFLKPKENSVFLEQRGCHEESSRGFVPYKRCLTERHSQSFMVTDEERDEKRIRLCL